MSKTKTRKPIEIKIATVVAVSAILNESNPAALDAAMHEITCGESDYFDDELAILDIGSIGAPESGIDWKALITLFSSYRLKPIAVRNASPAMHAEIIAHGLTLDTVAQPRTTTEPVAAPIEPAAPIIVAPTARPGAMLIDTPVRAGQRIYAQGRDLIVTAVVNNGAEVIADGSIHVYAPLRGRALAGASGDANARIFTMNMEAELVSIAGMYRTFEDGLPKNLARVPVQISLTGDRIDVSAMKF